MDERLPLAALDAPTLRMLLTQERAARAEVEQDVNRLRAAIERQNERIMHLEQQSTQLQADAWERRTIMTGLEEQNALLRQQVAALQTENARLRGDEPRVMHQPDPWPTERTKQDTPPKPRRKRNSKHNHGRQRAERVDETIDHADDACPVCGTALSGGWVHRSVQVIDLPAPQHAWVTEHRLIARHCPVCRTRRLPRPPALPEQRLGQCRFGPRLVAAIGHMATVERLPGRAIQHRLTREYNLCLSLGGIIGLLHRLAGQGKGRYDELQAEARASPVVHADETGWREDGVPGYIWTLSTPRLCLFHRDERRSSQVIDTLLGENFAGTLVTDFYAVYDHLDGPKQRCWAHLWRDITALQTEYPDDAELAAWVVGVRAIYQRAMEPRPARECAPTPEAATARARRAHRYEQELLRFCPDDLPATRPEATLVKRIRRYLPELFTFVRELDVPSTNNQAERNLRPLVIARKVSGGTRSPSGSQTRMILASLAATARLQGIDPAVAFQRLLTS
jgi:transposase